MHDDDSLRSSLTRRRFLQMSAGRLALLAQAAPAVRARRVGAAAHHPGRPERRRRGGSRHRLEPDRPAGAAARPLRDDGRRSPAPASGCPAPTSAADDFTARLDLTDLPPGQRIFYEARFEEAGGARSEPVRGSFRTPARTAAPVSIAWGGDVCGQGWGIDDVARRHADLRVDARASSRTSSSTPAISSTPMGRSPRR